MEQKTRTKAKDLSTDDSVRKVGHYILGETLGKGGFSWVKKAVDGNTRMPVALKFMMVEDFHFLKDQARRVYTEVKCMMRIDNRHVLKLLSYNLRCKYPEKSGRTLDTILLVFEYCPGGELFDILYYTEKLDVVTARTYFIQMMKGLKACHDAGIAHRDIKPQNLLLDANYQLKITDFGLSFMVEEGRDLDDVKIKESLVGTRGYQAPELLRGKRFTKASDIFSCGVVLFILLTGYPPFEQAWVDDNWYKPMCEGNSIAFWRKHTKVRLDDDCKHLLTRLLQYRPENRITLNECLRHKWVKGRNIHTPSQLTSLVQERLRATRRNRRKDREKMQDLQMSYKQKKTISCYCSKKKDKVKDNENNQKLIKCAMCKSIEDVGKVRIQVSTMKEFTPSLLTFYAQKTKLKEAYEAAVKVFNIVLSDKAQTTCSVKNPWNIKTHVKIHDGVSEKEVVIALDVQEIEGTGVVSFRYKRFQGDSVSFFRIMEAAESYLLTWSSQLFFDSLDDIRKIVDENKVDE